MQAMENVGPIRGPRGNATARGQFVSSNCGNELSRLEFRMAARTGIGVDFYFLGTNYRWQVTAGRERSANVRRIVFVVGNPGDRAPVLKPSMVRNALRRTH